MMICSRCGTDNTDNAKFCEKCGNPLVAGAVPKTPIIKDEDMPAVRPLTKLAYKIYDMDSRAIVKAVLYFLFFGLCVGILSLIAAIINTWNSLSITIGAGLRDIHIEAMDKARQQASAGTGRDLVIYFLLLMLCIILYVFDARILLRLKKVSRKEKKLIAERRENSRKEALLTASNKELQA